MSNKEAQKYILARTKITKNHKQTRKIQKDTKKTQRDIANDREI